MATHLLTSTRRGVEQTLGFRYEIEGAVKLGKDFGVEIKEIGRKISVPWIRGDFGYKTGRTDLDVVGRIDGKLTYFQLKSSPGSFRSEDHVQAWCEKARKQLKNELDREISGFDGIVFGTPGGPSGVPPNILKWLNENRIPIHDISLD